MDNVIYYYNRVITNEGRLRDVPSHVYAAVRYLLSEAGYLDKKKE